MAKSKYKSSQPKFAMPTLGKGKAKTQTNMVDPGKGPAGHRGGKMPGC